jgi:hypothetical protein
MELGILIYKKVYPPPPSEVNDKINNFWLF